MDYDLSVLYVFLIFTPVLFLVSWGLEVLVDTPAKNFAHAIDVLTRFDNPLKKKKKDGEADKEDEDDRTCSAFLAEQWFLWVLLGFVVAVGIVTEIYGAVNGNGDRIMAMSQGNSTASAA